MNKAILLPLLVLILHNEPLAQPNVRTTPASGSSRVIRLNKHTVDSLKSRGVPAGNIVKAYVPNMAIPNFESQLIETVGFMYAAKIFTPMIVSALRENYPLLSLASASKVIYYGFKKGVKMAPNHFFAFYLQDSISNAFDPGASRDNIGLLKQAGVSLEEIFKLYHKSQGGVSDDEPAGHSWAEFYTNMIKAGFTAEGILICHGWYAYNSDVKNQTVLPNFPPMCRAFCKGIRAGGVSATEFAQLFKKYKIYKENILLWLKEAGYNSTEIMKAMQTI